MPLLVEGQLRHVMQCCCMAHQVQGQAPRARRVREDENSVVVRGTRYTKLECVGRGGSSKVYKVSTLPDVYPFSPPCVPAHLVSTPAHHHVHALGCMHAGDGAKPEDICAEAHPADGARSRGGHRVHQRDQAAPEPARLLQYHPAHRCRGIHNWHTMPKSCSRCHPHRIQTGFTQSFLRSSLKFSSRLFV